MNDDYIVIETGEFNSYLVFGKVLIDIGVPYNKIKEYEDDIEVVLLTHQHTDHINYGTLKRLMRNRPGVVVAGGEWMEPLLAEKGITNYFIISVGDMVRIKDYYVMPERAVHNVPNVGYHLTDGETVVFHMTDTGSYDGIYAKNADIVAIEYNYIASMVDEIIAKEIRERGFSHRLAAKDNHSSFESADEFVAKRTKGKGNIRLVKLHTSSVFMPYL